MCADKIDIEQLRKSLRRRHSAAEKLKLASHLDPPVRQPIVYRRDVSSDTPTREFQASVSNQAVKLCDSVDGRETRGPDGGYSFLVESSLNASSGDEAALSTAFLTAIDDPSGPLRGHLLRADPLAGDDLEPEDLAFFDLETTGLSSSPVFLIGVMVWADGGLATKQFFARDYSEERPIISMFADCLVGKKMLVSFNGKSFDLPYMRARAAAAGVSFAFDGPHLDLLHVSRRAWKDKLPNCKLQTLEAHICGRHRTGDIPGHAIPQAYHDYVHSGDARHMVSTLEHNRLDLITLAELMIHLPAE
ncbi:MAG: ribonuclease H-like domain-containing protein [Phycisphaerae bacterium]|jgi:uncharacterized protein YprB with RNaseH-like and TPR domain|nr:ribonuclease H-like domain-containing protein [Phycisphaerae bacterium]